MTESGLGQRSARAGDGGSQGGKQAPWQGSGPQVLEALPGELEHDVQPRLPDRRGRTAAWPDGERTPRGI